MSCRICGGPTVERVNRSTGEVFQGCKAWPKCQKPLGQHAALEYIDEDEGQYDEDLLLDTSHPGHPSNYGSR